MGTVWDEVWAAELNPLLIANKASRKSMHSVQILQHIHGVGEDWKSGRKDSLVIL